jgi:glutaconate CoA-transferase, subunit A
MHGHRAPCAVQRVRRGIALSFPAEETNMREKLESMQAAAARVKSGTSLVMSANLERPPMAFLRELVRRKVRDLRVIGVVGGDLNIDFLVGAGAVSVVDTCSVTMGEFARTGPNFARHVLGARVRALDNT